jgi:hypothetical protein
MTKRIALAALAAIVLCTVVPALDVDESEISSARGAAIEFINYEGPHAVIQTAAEIRGIGQSLGTSIAGGEKRAGEIGRYFVIHAVDPAVKTGLDADIIVLGEGARVDHVKNLRRIVAGYLEKAYGYSTKDADTLAVFITIYNAVHRGDVGYFASKYKPVVTKELSPANAGLSVRWDEWAGRSRIVIPLTTKAGSGVLGSVDTTPITDKSTVQGLKAESPATAGVPERMDVVDLKERGQAEEKAAIDAERDRIAKEEAAIAAEKARIEDTKAAGTAGTAETGTKPSGDAAAGTDTGTAAPKGADQEAGIAVSDKARDEEAAAARAAAEKDVAAREAKVQEDKAALAAREDAAAAKDTEIAGDRAAIAGDQKDVIKGEVAGAASKEAGGVTLFELVDANLPLSRIARVDLSTGETIRRSTLNTIKAATIVDSGDAYIAIAGQVTGTGGAVRLVRVAKADFASVVQGTDDVFADGMVWKIGASVYTVVKKGDGWAIGRFDPATLELKANSAPVSRWTFLTPVDGKLVAQSPVGGFLVLEAEALTTASEVKR